MSVGEATVVPAAAAADGCQGTMQAMQAIQALRVRGAQRLDPIHFRFIEALARRAAAQDGEVGRLLQARLARLTADLGQRLAQHPAPAALALGRAGAALPGRATAPVARAAPAACSLLADLVRRLDSPAAPAAGHVPVAGELKALSYFRSTWSGLRVQRQLAQSLAQVPQNAGPLHSDRLVLRALQAMQDISPAYLNRFMACVETWTWLDQLDGDAGLPAKATRSGDDKLRKAPRAKPLRR